MGYETVDRGEGVVGVGSRTAAAVAGRTGQEVDTPVAGRIPEGVPGVDSPDIDLPDTGHPDTDQAVDMTCCR